jgi:mono/diheme cytochrome c family protein
MARTGIAGAAAALGLALVGAAPAGAEVEIKTDEDVKRFFATTCGYCHQGGGREAGRGPALMGTSRTDEYLINRIATGRQGKMPAYGQSLTLEQIEAIVRYIRGLKPEGEG